MSLNGCFYVVSTPLGHLSDITARALETLKSVDRIAAEDTRHTGALLRHFSITTPCFSLHDHNETARIEQVLGYLQSGESIALVSDAGTPLICDPGFKLVRALTQAGIKIVPVPGACAITTALVASGLPSDRIHFYGFSPAKQGARVKWLTQLQESPGTIVLYESKHRLLDSLQDMVSVFGDAPACVGRELTKEYESFYYGSLGEVLTQLKALSPLRGEFVVMIHHQEQPKEDLVSLSLESLLELVQTPMSKKAIAGFLADKTDYSKQELYRLLVDRS